MEITVSKRMARVPLTIVQVNGNIESATYQAFQAKADELLAAGAQYILVDLAGAPFISSAGLRVLHTIFNKLRAVHGESSDESLVRKIRAGGYASPYLKVANLSSQVRDAFVISGFDTYIQALDDLDTAIAAF